MLRPSQIQEKLVKIYKMVILSLVKGCNKQLLILEIRSKFKNQFLKLRRMKRFRLQLISQYNAGFSLINLDLKLRKKILNIDWLFIDIIKVFDSLFLIRLDYFQIRCLWLLALLISLNLIHFPFVQ